MKKIIILFFSFILIYSVSFSQSAWQWAYPKPQGNSTHCSWFLNSNTGFIGTESGTIMKTYNSGLNWKYVLILPYDTSGYSTSISDIEFIDLTTGYACSGLKSIFKTTNSGENWICISILPLYISQLSFVNSQTGFTLGSTGAVFKTTDGGFNWQQLPVGRWPFYDVKFINNNTGFVSTDSQKIYRTTDLGNSWQLIYTGEPNGGFTEFTFYNQNKGFANLYGGRYIKTTNAGLNWTSGSLGTSSNMSSICFIDSVTLLILGTNGAYYKSTNFGLNWSFNTLWNYSPDIYTSWKLINGDIFIAGRWGLMAKSTNYGLNFVTLAQNTNMFDNITGIGFANSQTGYAIGGDFFKTTDGGLNWLRTTQINSSLRDIFFINSSTGYISSGSMFFYKTTNSGTNWITINIGSNEIYPSKIYFLNETTGLSIINSGFIIRTTNGGQYWSKVDSAGMISYYNDLQFINMNTGFAVGGFGTFKRTTNGGQNWANMNSLGFQILNSICFKNNLTGFVGCENNTILKTTNGGNNWSSFVLPITFNCQIFDICFGNQNYGVLIAAGNNSERVMYTTNGGNSWLFSQCITKNDIYKIYALDSLKYIIAGSYGKIIYTETAGITDISNNQIIEIPKNSTLFQNYPNPFNPSTNIRYRITNNIYVLIKVYDITGKEIATLVNEKQAPGTYEIQFPNNSMTNNKLPSGVYFYKLTAGDYSETKKMILLK